MIINAKEWLINELIRLKNGTEDKILNHSPHDHNDRIQLVDKVIGYVRGLE